MTDARALEILRGVKNSVLIDMVKAEDTVGRESKLYAQLLEVKEVLNISIDAILIRSKLQ